MLENLERLEGKDPLTAALAPVVAWSHKPSLPSSKPCPDPKHAKLAKAKVRAWRKGKWWKDHNVGRRF